MPQQDGVLVSVDEVPFQNPSRSGHQLGHPLGGDVVLRPGRRDQAAILESELHLRLVRGHRVTDQKRTWCG
jgi:hypothetical protein